MKRLILSPLNYRLTSFMKIYIPSTTCFHHWFLFWLRFWVPYSQRNQIQFSRKHNENAYLYSAAASLLVSLRMEFRSSVTKFRLYFQVICLKGLKFWMIMEISYILGEELFRNIVWILYLDAKDADIASIFKKHGENLNTIPLQRKPTYFLIC
jgi:hypothetical protein